jgi:hypothetical protein
VAAKAYETVWRLSCATTNVLSYPSAVAETWSIASRARSRLLIRLSKRKSGFETYPLAEAPEGLRAGCEWQSPVPRRPHNVIAESEHASAGFGRFRARRKEQFDSVLPTNSLIYGTRFSGVAGRLAESPNVRKIESRRRNGRPQEPAAQDHLGHIFKRRT